MAVDDSFTKVLLHMNGADASTTFTDESGKTWTANTSAQIDTAQSVFGGASGMFYNVADYIKCPDHADFNFGSSNWTFDCWWRFGGKANNQYMLQSYQDATHYLYLRWLTTNNLNFTCAGGTGGISILWAWTPATGTWYHVEMGRSGSSWYAFIGGTAIGVTGTDADTCPDLTSEMRIGVGDGVEYRWCDEARLSVGVCRHTANFTVPTSEYGPPVAGVTWYY